MLRKKIIAFTGQVASGKGTAAAFFIRKYGAKVFKFSTMLRDILDRLYLPQSRENMQEISMVLRERFGQDLLAKVIAHDVERAATPLVIVDGARRPEDIEHLKKLNGFTLIAVAASPEIRYKRLTSRGENADDAAKTWEQFLKEEGAETEVLIPRLMSEADFTVNNDGDQEQLYRQLEELYAKLTGTGKS